MDRRFEKLKKQKDFVAVNIEHRPQGIDIEARIQREKEEEERLAREKAEMLQVEKAREEIMEILCPEPPKQPVIKNPTGPNNNFEDIWTKISRDNK